MLSKRTPSAVRRAALIGLSIIGLSLAGLWRGTAGAAAQQEPRQIDLVVLVDNSASMCCTPPPMDPEASPLQPSSLRQQMAHFFINFFGVDQSGNDYRLGFVYFGTDARTAAALAPVDTEADRQKMHDAIDAVPINMGWTDTHEALQLALAEVQSGRPAAKKAVVLLTDGEPRLPDWTDQDRDDYLDQLVGYINGDWPKEIPVYTVAIGPEAYQTSSRNTLYKNLWQQITVTTGAPADVGYQEARTAADLPNAYYQIMQSLLDLPIEVLPPPEPVPVTKQFVVDEQLSQIIFVILKDNPDISTTIYYPNGDVLTCPLSNDVASDILCARSGRTETISVRMPELGTWAVQLDGQGFIQFQAVRFALEAQFAVNLVAPLRGHPAGKPMTIEANVTERETGAVATTRSLSLVVEYPSLEKTAPMPMTLSGDRYVVVLDDTLEDGTYKLRFTAQIEQGPLESDAAVQVLNTPWLRIEEPGGGNYPSNLAVPITAQLMLLNQPMLQADPTWKLNASASLGDESGNILTTAILTPATGGVFRGEVDAKGEGARRVEASLLIETNTGEQFTDLAGVDFVAGPAVTLTPVPTTPPTATPPPTPTPGPTPTPPPPPNPAVVGGGIGGGLLLLIGGVGAVYYLRKPGLSGEMEVSGPSAATHYLKGKGKWTIGSDPKANIYLSDPAVAPKHLELRPHRGGIDLIDLIDDAEGLDRPQVKSKGDRHFAYIGGRHPLQDEDEIKLGSHTLTYHNAALNQPEFDNDAGGDIYPDTDPYS